MGCSESHDHNKTTKSITLAPRATRSFTIKAHHETRVSFVVELTEEKKKKCKKGCIKMMSLDSRGEGEAIYSDTSGRLEIQPISGQIKVIFQNMELFPIKVLTSW